MIWAISPDEAERLSKFRDGDGIGFPLLIDAQAATAAAWGIRNEGHGVPHPTVAIVDPSGNIGFFHLDEDFRQRPAPEVIVKALEKLRGDSPKGGSPESSSPESQ